MLVMLMEKPSERPQAPTIETGTASSGIMVARQFCRKTNSEDDERDRLEQCHDHIRDRGPHEPCRVESNPIIDASGEAEPGVVEVS